MSIFWASTADGFSGTLPCRDGHLHLVRIPSDKRELCERIDRLCQNSLELLPGTVEDYKDFFLLNGFKDTEFNGHVAVALEEPPGAETEEVTGENLETPQDEGTVTEPQGPLDETVSESVESGPDAVEHDQEGPDPTDPWDPYVEPSTDGATVTNENTNTMPQLELTIGAKSPIDAEKVFTFPINAEEGVFFDALIPVVDPGGNGEIDEEFKETIPIDEKVLWFTVKEKVDVDIEIKLRVIPNPEPASNSTTPSQA